MVMGKEEGEERAMKEVGVKEEAATASGQIPTRQGAADCVRQIDTSRCRSRKDSRSEILSQV